ncbi:hypothetical protein [Paenibacillus aquistagni]|uniref:hypothetical protein n=1 Tax=Paenibacillus aquistagni TaxID=1852522 RepID=UPI00145B134E|nr:hypothetical protein [Paenibacillus aquistagni]NMM51886.1 hypothetical protein [Paenibacillus aquistagni]
MKTTHNLNETKAKATRYNGMNEAPVRWNPRWLEAARAACAVVFLGEGSEAEADQQPKGA